MLINNKKVFIYERTSKTYKFRYRISFSGMEPSSSQFSLDDLKNLLDELTKLSDAVRTRGSEINRLIERPTILKSLDWVDLCYPEHLKNVKISKMQKDHFVSVAGRYEDFRSVTPSFWHHVAVGEKIILLIEPTLDNLKLFYDWSVNSNKNPAFFADRVERCQLVELKEGSTLMVPSGWIHFEFAPSDSLVFGGKFMCSFTWDTQFKVLGANKELNGDNDEFRFYTELSWFALDIFRGKSHMIKRLQRVNKVDDSAERTSLSLISCELKMLKKMIKYLRRNIAGKPERMFRCKELLNEARQMVIDRKKHVEDSWTNAVLITYWASDEYGEVNRKKKDEKYFYRILDDDGALTSLRRSIFDTLHNRLMEIRPRDSLKFQGHDKDNAEAKKVVEIVDVLQDLVDKVVENNQ